MILPPPAPVQPLVYSTMPSLWANRPELAMDGDEGTAFRSTHGMGPGDAFVVTLGQAVDLRSVRVLTGDGKGEDAFEGTLEVSTDGTTYVKAADFDARGVAEARSLRGVGALRLRVGARRRRGSGLVLREVRLDAGVPFAPAMRGPGRGFVDLNGFNDLRAWAAKAEAQTEAFWPDAAALLYSKGFVTPNAVNVVYRSGPRVTAVAATGGGEMEVNADYARKHPGDTGLTVHEMTHVVQSGGSPGWLVEAVADYVRWVRFEPENFTFRINPSDPPQQPYRAGAVFLAWCENHYDPWLVTQLNDAARFGRYSDGLFAKYCGRDINVLYAEFLADYARDPKGILAPPVPEGMRRRSLPTVVRGSGHPVDMRYDTLGITVDGTKVRANGGFDGEGATLSTTALGSTVSANGVEFRLEPAGGPTVLSARGQTFRLSGRRRSLWLLGAAIEGAQSDQTLTVTYTDGTTARFVQNFSDWFEPSDFPGEVRAVRMGYRNRPDGGRDERPFNVYAYGFPVDHGKELASVTLPDNRNVRVLALSTAD